MSIAPTAAACLEAEAELHRASPRNRPHCDDEMKRPVHALQMYITGSHPLNAAPPDLPHLWLALR